MPKPTVGRIVHYVSHGTPVRADGGQAYASQCRAAIITGVPTDPPAGGHLDIGLAVLNPKGMFFNLGVPYDEPAEVAGDPNCSMQAAHGTVFRYCACGWREAAKLGGTWHWPEREDS